MTLKNGTSLTEIKSWYDMKELNLFHGIINKDLNFLTGIRRQ
jgi:hypothetical protein